jgi:ankyrin repeat protein
LDLNDLKWYLCCIMTNAITYTPDHPLAQSHEISHVQPPETNEDALFRAVTQANVLEIKKILDIGCDLNCTDTEGWSILEVALTPFDSQSGITPCEATYESIHLLLAAGAPYTQRIYCYSHLFDYAFATDNYRLLRELSTYYSPHIEISYLSLHMFFKRNSSEVLKQIIRLYPVPGSSFQNYLVDRSYLKHAIQVVGFDCNQKNSIGDTLLHLLANNIGDMQCVRVLLANKADLFLPNNFGRTPLQIACQMNNTPFLTQVFDSDVSKSVPRSGLPLHEAIIAGDEERIKKELAGADLQAQDIFGITALKTALRYSVLSAVKLLCQKMTVEDLQFAAGYSCVEVISFLLTLPLGTQNQKELVLEIFDQASLGENNEVVRWILERYVLEYPDDMGRLLTRPKSSTSSLTLLQECVDKMKQLHIDRKDGVGTLMLGALQTQKQEFVSFLFNHIEDLSWFDNVEVEQFYTLLAGYPDAALLEQAFAKFKIPDKIFTTENFFEPLAKTHPELFQRLSCEWFERGWALYKKEQKPGSKYLVSLAQIAAYSGNKEFVEHYYLECILPDHKQMENILKSILQVALERGYSQISTYIKEKIFGDKDGPVIAPKPSPSLLIIEERDTEGKTALFRAAEQGKYSEVKKLLALGYNPNTPDIKGRSILEACVQQITLQIEQTGAITGKFFSIIQALISQGAYSTRPVGKYKNIFDFAFCSSNYGLLFVLHPYFKPHIKLDKTALDKFFATCEGPDLEFITTHYPHLDLQNKSETICHIFIQRDRLDLLMKYAELAPHKFTQYLQDKPTNLDHEKYSLLALALFSGKTEIAQFLRLKGATFAHDPLLLVLCPEITKQFLDEGMNCDEQDFEGKSALHYLAWGGVDISCLPILLQRGANLFLEDTAGGVTPFQQANVAENFEFMQIAVKTDAFTQLSRPALHQACLMNDAVAVEQLVATSDSTIEDSLGFTALEVAILTHSLSAVKLLSHCASEDNLSFAATWGSVEVVSCLFNLLLPKIHPMLDNLFHKAEKAGNNAVSQWIGKEYPFQCSKAFCKGIFLELPSSNALAIFEHHLEWLKKRPERTIIVKELLTKASQQNQCQITNCLLDLEDAHSAVNHMIRYTILTGEMSVIQRLYEQFEHSPHMELLKSRELVQFAIEAGLHEVVAYLLQKVKPLQQDQTTLAEAELIFAIKAGILKSIQVLSQVYATQKITPNYGNICMCILRTSPKEQQKKHLHLAIQLLRSDFSKAESEEIALLLMDVAAFSHAVHLIISFARNAPSVAHMQECAKEVVSTVHKLLQVCKVPCGRYSFYETVDWLVEQLFLHCRQMNGSLFKEKEFIPTLMHLVSHIRKNEDYGALLVALQVAPSVESARNAFLVAVGLESGEMIKPSKEVFLGKSRDEQKSMLAYARVYRDRSFLPHCCHILKNYTELSCILVDALNVLSQLGVKHYNQKLENIRARDLQHIIQTYKNEEVKKAALNAYMVMEANTPQKLDFLLQELNASWALPPLAGISHKLLEKCGLEYQIELVRALRGGYEWHSDEECAKAAACLLPGLESPSLEVRMETVKTLVSIPNEKGLLAALDVVQSSTWDRMLPYFGKDRLDIQGSFLTFRHRPKEIHDNRSSMIRSIVYQLVSVHEKNKQFCTLMEQTPPSAQTKSFVEQSFQTMNAMNTRYTRIPVTYPPHTDLVRGISTRKGGIKFREAVRDLFRKGAGSSELTDYDSSLYSNTWNKIGHMFASHSKDLFFGTERGSTYFSADDDGKAQSSALIVFPASYYHKEYLAGEARLEKESYLNNVLYRGIPHRWIKAVYLPMRFQSDIDQLASNTPLEDVRKKLTSDLFAGDSLQELKSFRTFLLAREVDLTQTPIKEVAFVEKIRYFPAVDVKKVGEILVTNGVSFATEQQIIEETIKFVVKRDLLVNRYYKNSWRFQSQDRYLTHASDHEFKENQELFFKMMPAFLGPINKARQIILGEEGCFGLQTDDLGAARVLLRVAALLLGTGKQPQEVLSQNPQFYGLTKQSIPIVDSLLRQYMFVKSLHTDDDTKQKLTQAFTALKCTTLSFDVYCQMLERLYVAVCSKLESRDNI